MADSDAHLLGPPKKYELSLYLGGWSPVASALAVRWAAVIMALDIIIIMSNAMDPTGIGEVEIHKLDIPRPDGRPRSYWEQKWRRKPDSGS